MIRRAYIRSLLFRNKFYRDPSEGPSRIWRDEQGNICRVRHSVRKDLSQAKQMLERAARRAALLPRVPRDARFRLYGNLSARSVN